MKSRSLAPLSATLALASLLACSQTSGESPLAPTPAGRLGIEQIAASASAQQVAGIRRSGMAPASAGGPRITATANQRVVVGGTQTIAVSGEEPFSRVYLFVGGRSLGLLGESAGGIDGYYEITLPSPEREVSVLLTLPQEMALTEFDLQVAVANASGAIGPFVALSTTVLGVGTGDVQVTLAWNTDSDVDLHVVGGDGEEIFYGRRRSASGGELDLDSNAGCRIDGVRNENITWPVGRAPRGPYTVRVNYWSNCGVQRTDYTVRVNNGGAVQLMTGTFTGPGQGGALGAGQVVITFERTTGPLTTSLSGTSALSGVIGPIKTLVAPGGVTR